MNDHAPHTAAAGAEIEPGVLAFAVVTATSVLLLIGLVTAFFDRKLATLTAREALALKQSEERLRALYRNSSDIVAILDADGVFTYEASSARNILGYRTRDLVGRSLLDLVPRDRAVEARQFLGTMLASGNANVRTELCARHADGTWRDFEVIGKNLLGDPAIGGLVINMRDISERKRLMAELERLSETDALTGMLNRRGFMKLAAREFDRMARARQPLTLVMLDIDHFKGVNDTFGHAAGDLVLAAIAECCRKHVRSIEVLSRFGGEEFMALLPGADLSAAQKIVDRIHKEVARTKVPTIKGEVSVTASFGIAAVHPGSIDLETAIRLADEALYEAKNSGRNCIKIRA